MKNILSPTDRLYSPNKISRIEADYWSVYKASKFYNYWKKRLSNIEKDITRCKKVQSILFSESMPNSTTTSYYKLQTKKDIIYARLLKQEALKNYYEAKKIYLKLQKKCSLQLEADTPIWKTIHGKYLHTIEVIRKSNNELHVYYYVRLNKPYTNFLDFLRDYNILDILEKEKDIYKKYDLLGFADFANLEGFFKSNDYIVEISPCGDRQVACLDFVQYNAFKSMPGSLADKKLTYDDFKEAFQYNSGESLKGMKQWFADNFRDVLERKFPGQEAYDIVDVGYFKKSYESWKRYYDMWQVNETPAQRRVAKSKD